MFRGKGKSDYDNFKGDGYAQVALSTKVLAKCFFLTRTVF